MFKIVNETYVTMPGENPEKYGCVEGYSACGGDYLRLNVYAVPDERQYSTYERSNCLSCFEYRPGRRYGTGIRLNRRQVRQLIFELIKWLMKN